MNDRTSLEVYFEEICRYALITPEDEIKLARRIKRGDRAALDTLVNANLRIVVRIARGYEKYGLPLLDLISEGNIGLMTAAKRFDPKHGAKFSTYAAFWIKQHVRRALSNQSRIIRLPVHISEKVGKVLAIAEKLAEELDREPTDEEIAAEMNCQPVKVHQIRGAATGILSLSNEVEGMGGTGLTVENCISDERAEIPGDGLNTNQTLAILRESIKTLPPRMQEILTYRYGLDGEPERTLEQVGAKFQITRERVRQIQNQALGILKKRISKFNV